MAKIAPILLTVVLVLCAAPDVLAHAFPENSSPHVGSELTASPNAVKIWFDGDIEPVFSTLIVKNAGDTQVSHGRGQVDASDKTLLETALAGPLPPGQYWVYWSVIARDGHHTAGRFPFTVQ